MSAEVLLKMFVKDFVYDLHTFTQVLYSCVIIMMLFLLQQ